MERNASWPAVSQIWSLICLPSTKDLRELNKKARDLNCPSLTYIDHASTKFNSDGQIIHRLKSFVSKLQK